MSRSVRLVLLSLTLFLILFPLAAVRPGQPPTFKADEPAYFLMALSLVEDGDLLCDIEDVQRAFDHYPYRPVDNLILMSPDGWETIYFGKPYIYSLFAAPAAALFGANGLVMFNMVLLMSMVWMGAWPPVCIWPFISPPTSWAGRPGGGGSGRRSSAPACDPSGPEPLWRFASTTSRCWASWGCRRSGWSPSGTASGRCSVG